VSSADNGKLKIGLGIRTANWHVPEAWSRLLLSFAQSTYNAALMFALILLILVVILLIFALAGRLERYLLRWN
jgi:hypothetical protein